MLFFIDSGQFNFICELKFYKSKGNLKTVFIV